jgi:putative transcriptional regulator
MPITHHPPDDTVLRYATGTLPEAPAIVIATHLSFCPECRHRMETFEMLGGSLLDGVPPAKLSPDALSATLARLDAETGRLGEGDTGAEADAMGAGKDGKASGLGGGNGGSGSSNGVGGDSAFSRGATQTPVRAAASPVRPIAPAAHQQRPDLPSGMDWPQTLRHYDIPRWRFLVPGVKWTALSLPGPEAGQLLLLRGAAGTKLPSHGHEGSEYTCVLTGSFSDSNGIYTAGDLIEASEDLDHQPIVSPDAECVCLIAIEGHLRLHGLARLLQPFLRL